MFMSLCVCVCVCVLFLVGWVGINCACAFPLASLSHIHTNTHIKNNSVPGVTATAVGYTQGHLKEPSYEETCSGNTGHTEAIQVAYNEQEVTYEELLKVFWDRIDPLMENGQGGDRGVCVCVCVCVYVCVCTSRLWWWGGFYYLLCFLSPQTYTIKTYKHTHTHRHPIPHGHLHPHRRTTHTRPPLQGSPPTQIWQRQANYDRGKLSTHTHTHTQKIKCASHTYRQK
jgi:hypothetical protein